MSASAELRNSGVVHHVDLNKLTSPAATEAADVRPRGLVVSDGARGAQTEDLASD